MKQPKDGHRFERPVTIRTQPRTVTVTKCECGVRFKAENRFQLKAQHRTHREKVT